MWRCERMRRTQTDRFFFYFFPSVTSQSIWSICQRRREVDHAVCSGASASGRRRQHNWLMAFKTQMLFRYAAWPSKCISLFPTELCLFVLKTLKHIWLFFPIKIQTVYCPFIWLSTNSYIYIIRVKLHQLHLFFYVKTNSLCFHDCINWLTLTGLTCGGPCHLSSFKQVFLELIVLRTTCLWVWIPSPKLHSASLKAHKLFHTPAKQNLKWILWSCVRQLS